MLKNILYKNCFEMYNVELVQYSWQFSLFVTYLQIPDYFFVHIFSKLKFLVEIQYICALITHEIISSWLLQS